jgi:hypothetical protein
MPTWGWIVIIIGAVIVLALVLRSIRSRRRTEGLRSQFGPEYDRTVAGTGDRREAESVLDARRERRQELTIRTLPDVTRQRYADEWRSVQARFVDEPARSLGEADQLVTSVMNERGYPMEDFESNVGVVSVDHPNVVDNYRAAHQISVANQAGRASTEDLRRGMVYFRALFEELLAVDRESAQGVG